MNYYKTHILKILVHKKLLKAKLDFLFGENAGEIESFLVSVFFNQVYEQNTNVAEYIPLLLKRGYISTHDSDIWSRSSLMGVRAVNFELTYKCNSRCPHCLQKNVRRNCETELTTDKIKETILEAYLSGLCTSGINFTGGEVLGNRADLFDIFKYTRSLDIPYRLNSNSWWSRKKRLKICTLTFPSALALVEYLKSLGLNQFAFSYDIRLENFKLRHNLVESIRICEKARVFYQVIFTGINPEELNGHIIKLKNEIGHNLYYLIPVSAEMVDIGGASDLSSRVYGWQSNLCSCKKKGFYHPYVLHINPEGKVRSCMYAVGLSDAGDVSRMPLADIINRYPTRKNSEIFSSLAKNTEAWGKLVMPYSALYKPIIHECTANVILAKTVEMFAESNDPDLEVIHKAIAKELNLTSDSID